MSKIDLQRILDRATKWQEASAQYEHPKVFRKVQRFMQDKTNKNFMIETMDQGFRANPKRTETQVRYLLERKYPKSVEDFFSPLEQAGIKVGLKVSEVFPGFMNFFMKQKTLYDSKTYVVPLAGLSSHLKKNRTGSIKSNVNQIGEEVLSEQEATHRLQEYLDLLDNPEVNYISIKASTVYSQINPIAMDHSVQKVAEKLRILYAHAIKNASSNQGVPKFVNLDMEEYKDLQVTILAFKQVLDEPDFQNYTAGIVLQAYLPDSHQALQDLAKWAKDRLQKGFAPIKVRIVKGANMEMEKTEASLRHWAVAPYEVKTHTDSNYKRMLEFAFSDDNFKAVRIGVASHNLFDIAFAYELISDAKAFDYVDFEMLQGIGQLHYETLKQDIPSFVFYTPTCSKEGFTNAIGYLVRRLDENSAADNFLNYISTIEVGNKDWELMKSNFITSYHDMYSVQDTPKRTQDRNHEISEYATVPLEEFVSEPDTDFALVANQEWAKTIKTKWEGFAFEGIVPLVIDGEEITRHETFSPIDKTQDERPIAKVSLAQPDDVARAIETAKVDETGFGSMGVQERGILLRKVADEIKKARGDLIGIAAVEVGKVFEQTDVEISEAIDFLNFYTHAHHANTQNPHVDFTPKGVGLALTPWNFPIAIPVGSITAALATGNRVIFKPSKESVLCGWYICQCFYRAGVSKKVLQFVPMEDAVAGSHLVTNPKVDFAIFTGSNETANRILEANPRLFFSGETGGKNAMIVSSLCDREQAVKAIVQSAFLNSGQKCSAASLVVLEKEVFNDQKFRKALSEAASSFKVGSPFDLQNKIGTLAQRPSGNLQKAIDAIESNETWDLAPSFVGDNPYMMTPSIRWGTTTANFTYANELFGPMCSVLCAKDLDEAIEIVNGTGYGLTSGLQTLDEAEKKKFIDKIEAGNLYINRETTGAIVLRQPFGGMKKSAVGSGQKAGFYNYLPQFCNIGQKPRSGHEGSFKLMYPDVFRKDPSWGGLEVAYQYLQKNGTDVLSLEQFEKSIFALSDYMDAQDKVFARPKDHAQVRGEENVLRYLPVRHMLFRCFGDDDLFDVLAVIFASRVVRHAITVSFDPKAQDSELAKFLLKQQSVFLQGNGAIVFEDDKSLKKRMLEVGRFRTTSKAKLSDEVVLHAAKHLIFVAGSKPTVSGRLELLNHYMEQSISNRFHRYGNLVGEQKLFRG